MESFLSHICFPVQFESEKLQADLKRILDAEWQDHFNTSVYSGKWTSVSLFSKGGDSRNIFAVDSSTEHAGLTTLAAQAPYMREVLSFFQCELLSARLLCLAPGSYIRTHRDHCLNYLDGEFRIHIPVQTNPEVVFMLDGERLEMQEGTCWYIDANEEHSVTNNGTEDRIHLVIDMKRNAWSDSLFFKEVAGEHRFKKMPDPMKEADLLKLISELERMKTPVADELINQLKSVLIVK